MSFESHKPTQKKRPLQRAVEATFSERALQRRKNDACFFCSIYHTLLLVTRTPKNLNVCLGFDISTYIESDFFWFLGSGIIPSTCHFHGAVERVLKDGLYSAV